MNLLKKSSIGHVEDLKRVGSEVEPKEYWVRGMFISYYIIIPNNKFIHLTAILHNRIRNRNAQMREERWGWSIINLSYWD